MKFVLKIRLDLPHQAVKRLSAAMKALVVRSETGFTLTALIESETDVRHDDDRFPHISIPYVDWTCKILSNTGPGVRRSIGSCPVI